MDYEHPQEPFNSFPRRSQSLCNERCQNILYKAVLEHFIELPKIAAVLLTSKFFQNSSFGVNFLVNFVVDKDSIDLLESVLSPSSCFSLQFAPSLDIYQYWNEDLLHIGSYYENRDANLSISAFVDELVKTKYLHLSLRSLTLNCDENALYSFVVTSNTKVEIRVLSCFFGASSYPWPQLKELTLRNSGVNGQVLETISKNAVHLHTLKLPGNRSVIASGLEYISKLSGITSLDVSWCKEITDAGLEHLSKLADITSLDLTSCNNITDAGVEHLSKLSVITSLFLNRCGKITDASLEHLAKLSRITFLDLYRCDKVTFDAQEKLKTALPQCTIRS